MRVSFSVRRTGDEDRTTIEVSPRRVILGGYTARSVEQRDRHIEELRRIGIEPPPTVPAFWHVSDGLVTTAGAIQVQGHRTSGEAEFALVAHRGQIYVTVASDQTDREFERHSIPRSKQLCAKVLGSEVTPLDDVLAAWDDALLESEVSPDGDAWIPYQRSSLAELLPPRRLLEAAFGRDALSDETILLSGTVPLVDGETRYLPYFRARLTFPGPGPRMELAYRVEMLSETVEASPGGPTDSSP